MTCYFDNSVSLNRCSVRSRKDNSYREYRRHNAMVYVLSIGHGVHNISIQYHTIQYNTIQGQQWTVNNWLQLCGIYVKSRARRGWTCSLPRPLLRSRYFISLTEVLKGAQKFTVVFDSWGEVMYVFCANSCDPRKITTFPHSRSTERSSCSSESAGRWSWAVPETIYLHKHRCCSSLK